MRRINFLLVLTMLCTLNTVYSQEYLKVNGSNHMTGSLEINKESGYSSIELKSGVGAFIDFTSDHTSDFNGRIIWNYYNSNKFDILGDVRFKNSVNLDYASANEFIVNTRFFLRKPEKVEDWNTNWGSSFVESYNAKNAPEESGWFWGLNMNHGSNNESYRFNGQIAIKNSSTKPTMYFRSTTSDGTGVWAKVLTNRNNQYIDGGLTLNGKLLSKEVMVRTDIEVPDYVFKEDYALMSLEEVEKYIKKHSHLPEVKSASEIEEEGLHVAEMNLILLKKIEELTLHTIEQEKQIKDLTKALDKDEKQDEIIIQQQKLIIQLLKKQENYDYNE